MTRTVYVKRPEVWKELADVAKTYNKSQSELVETAIAEFLRQRHIVAELLTTRIFKMKEEK